MFDFMSVYNNQLPNLNFLRKQDIRDLIEENIKELLNEPPPWIENISEEDDSEYLRKASPQDENDEPTQFIDDNDDEEDVVDPF